MRIQLKNLILVLLSVAFLSSCSSSYYANTRYKVKRVYHKRKKAKDCGCELMIKKAKTYFVA
jgi:hypothetical protein